MTDIWLATNSLAENSLGRTYSLWLLARANGWSTDVVATKPTPIWAPLAGTEFAQSCRVLTPEEVTSLTSAAADKPRLVIGVKSVAQTVSLFRAITALGIPGFLDVDDPDIEHHLNSGSLRRRLAHELRHPKGAREWKRLRRFARAHTRIVSNPELVRAYGGTVVPHVREDLGPGMPHTRRGPLVAFIGTNRPHKGIEQLRGAVAELAPLGFRLLITDTAPSDAKAWEDWIGPTTLERGLELVHGCDIVATPSLRQAYAFGQVPVKLIDAMLAARPVIVSDVGPLPWAVGEGGIVVEAGSRPALVGALRELADPFARERLGACGRKLALERYTVEAQRENFRTICERYLVTNPTLR